MKSDIARHDPIKSFHKVIFSGKKYRVKRRFIKDVECEVVSLYIPLKTELP